MRLGPLGGLDHLHIRGIGAAIFDVVAHRAVQQAAVLLNHADLPPQAFLCHRGNILPIDRDPPAFGVIKPQHQLDQGRFSRPRPPDNADLLARPDGQRDLIKATRATAIMV